MKMQAKNAEQLTKILRNKQRISKYSKIINNR